MKRPAAILFDLDDTLYPERQFVDGGFAAVAQFVASLTGRSSPAELTSRLIALHHEQGRGRLFDTLLAELDLPVDGDLVLACVLTYRTHEPSLQPFPGAVDVLRGVRAAGIRTGLVSDGHAATQHRKLSALPDVERLLDVVVMTDDLGDEHAKPSKMPFLVACRLLAIAPADAVYVANDSRKDFLGARGAGLRTIQVGRPPDEGRATMTTLRSDASADADLIVDTIVEALPAMLGEGGEL
jgi:putative hydrolase of the HAD superfamily